MQLSKLFKIPKEKEAEILAKAVTILYNFKKHTFHCKNINYPKDMQCIFALWHAHQCGIYGLEDREKLNVLISRSKDGDIISKAVESLGMKVVRGSQSRGGAVATLALIDKLKEGENIAITVDGPRGPMRIAKKGVVEIAKITGVPIVPMTWYSKSLGFLKFDTWDQFRFPMDFIRTIAIYGEPIHVPNDIDDEAIELYRQKVETELRILYSTAQKNYYKLLRGK